MSAALVPSGGGVAAARPVATDLSMPSSGRLGLRPAMALFWGRNVRPSALHRSCFSALSWWRWWGGLKCRAVALVVEAMLLLDGARGSGAGWRPWPCGGHGGRCLADEGGFGGGEHVGE